VRVASAKSRNQTEIFAEAENCGSETVFGLLVDLERPSIRSAKSFDIKVMLPCSVVTAY